MYCIGSRDSQVFNSHSIFYNLLYFLNVFLYAFSYFLLFFFLFWLFYYLCYFLFLFFSIFVDTALRSSHPAPRTLRFRNTPSSEDIWQTMTLTQGSNFLNPLL